MVGFVVALGLLTAGFGAAPAWFIPVGALFLVDRSWHAQHAYRGRFSITLADNILPYATLMCVLQAGITASAAYGLGRILGAALVG
jgi:hypothetical protein